jgi:chemotaxis protein CheX
MFCWRNGLGVSVFVKCVATGFQARYRVSLTGTDGTKHNIWSAAMKLEHINPFIASVEKLFSTMLSSKARHGTIGMADGVGGRYQLTSLIGLSGKARGTVSLSFPNETAIEAAKRLVMADSTEVDKTVIDTVAEMANIVAGGAKAKFVKGDEEPIELSLPYVIRGNNFKVIYPSDSVWLEIPFESDLGPFSMRLTFEMKKKR